jgi:CBS domain-containing protein
MTIKEVLRNKGPEVFTIGEERTISDAIKILVNNNIGVLLVLNSDAKISGILSERDIVRVVHANPADFESFIIKEKMTTNVIFIEATDSIEYAQQIMTTNHIRHLPVLDNKILIGMISIGDIVNSLLSKTQVENKYLQDYISGNLIG